MHRFMTHEPLEKSMFNRDFTSGVGALSPWAEELRNRPPVTALLLQRLQSDYERLNPKMRKAYNGEDVDAWPYRALHSPSPRRCCKGTARPSCAAGMSSARGILQISDG